MAKKGSGLSAVVCVPAYQEGENIRATLDSILRAVSSSNMAVEILVAAGVDAVCTYDHARAHLDGVKDVRLLREECRQGKASAMNAMAAMTETDVLVFCDADVIAYPDSIAKLVEYLEVHPAHGVVSSRVLTLRGESRFWSLVGDENARALNDLRKAWRDGESWMICGHLFAIRRSVWEPIPVGVVTDDAYIGLRLRARGIGCGYCPDACVGVRPPQSWSDYVKQKLRNRMGRMQLRDFEKRLGTLPSAWVSLLAGRSAGIRAARFIHVIAIDGMMTLWARILLLLGRHQSPLWERVLTSKSRFRGRHR